MSMISFILFILLYFFEDKIYFLNRK
jgi:hypothetical protein